MYAPVRTVDVVRRPGYVAAALLGLAVPLVSLSLVGLMFFYLWPIIEFSIFILFLWVAAAANLLNLIVSFRALRASLAPIWFRNVIGVAGVFPGVYLGTVAVLLGWFATLGL